MLAACQSVAEPVICKNNGYASILRDNVAHV